MKREPEMEEFLNAMALAIFGRERAETYCVTCGSEKVGIEDFKDNLSRTEFKISRMCQKCQNRVFDPPVDPPDDDCPHCLQLKHECTCHVEED